MRRIELPDEFAFSDGKPVRTPQELGDRLAAEPTLETEAWQHVDEGSLERWLHDTGWEEPARHIAQMRKQKGPRLLADLVRLLQGKPSPKAPSGPAASPVNAESAPRPVGVEPTNAVSRVSGTMEPSMEHSQSAGDSALLERQHQAIRTFLGAEAALHSAAEEEARRTAAEEQEAREEADARRAETERLRQEATAIQAQARAQLAEVNLDVKELPSEATGRGRATALTHRLAAKLSYILAGVGAVVLLGIAFFIAYPHLASDRGRPEGIVSGLGPSAGNHPGQARSRISPPRVKPSQPIEVARTGKVQDQLNTAQRLSQEHEYARALTFLRAIGEADRRSLIESGTDVRELEQEVLRKADSRLREELDLLFDSEIPSTSIGIDGVLAKCRQIETRFPEEVVRNAGLKSLILDLEAARGLTEGLDEIRRLCKDGRHDQAHYMLDRMKSRYGSLISKYDDLGAAMGEIESAIAAARRWDRGFEHPVDRKVWNLREAFGVSNAQWGGYHSGEDWDLPDGAAAGKTIRAAGAGIVFKVAPLVNTRGSLIAVLHRGRGIRPFRVPYAGSNPGSGYEQRYERIEMVYTVYAHVVPAVREGDTVRGGDVIGHVADLQAPASPHLHFEIRGPQTDGVWSDDGSMVYAKVAQPRPVPPRPGGSRERLGPSGNYKDPKTWIGIGKEILDALSDKDKDRSENSRPVAPQGDTAPEKSSENWADINGITGGYYRDPQKMVQAGLIDPTAFIEANPAER